MSMKEAQVLRRAADVIRKRGHCKLAREDVQGRVCAAGAIGIAVSGSISTCLYKDEMCTRLLRVLGTVAAEQYPDRVYLLSGDDRVPAVRFNDHPVTRPEEVLAVFEKAAVRLEEEA